MLGISRLAVQLLACQEGDMLHGINSIVSKNVGYKKIIRWGLITRMWRADDPIHISGKMAVQPVTD
jgi:hypothetical protein